MTVYRGTSAGAQPATSGHLPAVRRRRRVMRWLLAFVVVALVVNVLVVEA